MICNYESDLGKTFYYVPAVYRQKKIAEGFQNLSIEEVVPAEIDRNIIKTGKSSCKLPFTPRELLIFDLVGAEWTFTIPFKPYSSRWDNLLQELGSNDLIRGYKIRGEIIKYQTLTSLLP